MILDYSYSQYKKQFSVSYIDEDGNKQLWTKNVQRFKSYRYNPDGKLKCWDGRNCEEYWTETPKGFDIKTFMRELPSDIRDKFFGKKFPNLFTFDIETEISEDFPDPAINPITAISVCSPTLDTIVLGTRSMTSGEIASCEKRFKDYIDSIPYFKEIGLALPKFHYMVFASEEEMIKYFLVNIVAKVPVLSGWNCVNFDWWYIVNRIRKAFPSLNIAMSSCVHQTENRTAISNFGATNERLPMPVHTYICDMMEIVQWDHTVMPIKDNVSLDYIATKSVGKGKIKYKGDLQKLFDTDYPTYVYYNAIDSVLVQLINKKFKTIDVFYIYSLYTGEKIEKCFGQIALSEALVWNYFYEHGKKVVEYDIDGRPSSSVVGAYVKQPKAGLYQYITCNDFASLYPSSIITTNISFENYVGAFYDEEKLKPYRNNKDFVVICASVYKVEKEKGKKGKPKAGELVGTFLDEKSLKKYRDDPNYFVSVNGHVYHNDKDYAFREIQAELKANRNVSKYLSKQLDAEVMLDCEHLKKGRDVKLRVYSDSLVNALCSIGYDTIKNSDDLKKFTMQELDRFMSKLDGEIKFRGAEEQGMKLMGNAMYGGTGNVSFFWFSNELANDVTGEGRNLIHIMERHLATYFKEHWVEMTDWHQKWGIIVDPNLCVDVFSNYDPIIYGDTDSIYMEYSSLMKTCIGSEDWTDEEKLKFVLNVNLDFLNDHNRKYMEDYFSKRHAKSIQNFELETVAKSGVWLNVKKRYAQILLWKDGKFYDSDSLPLKVKGLEIIKSSYPEMSRESLKSIVRFMLENSTDEHLIHRLNILVQEYKDKFYNAPIDEICGTVGLSNYSKYITNDTGRALECVKGTPYQVRAAGNYNWLKSKYNLPGDPLRTGKIKWYKMRRLDGSPTVEFFAYPAGDYPDWADKYAPIARDEQFRQMVLEPLNRIISAIGMPELRIDGSVQMSLLDLF